MRSTSSVAYVVRTRNKGLMSSVVSTILLLLLLLLTTQAENAQVSKDRVKRGVRAKLAKIPRVPRPYKAIRIVQSRGHAGAGLHPTAEMTPEGTFEESETYTLDGCAPPEVMVNGKSVPERSSEEFSSGQEIQFLGIIGPTEQKRSCKIKCLDGVWVGPLCIVDEASRRFQLTPRPCSLTLNDPTLVISYQGEEISTAEGDTQVPHRGAIQLRCTEVGLYKFVGNSTLICHNGHWSGYLPHCIQTTLQRNFSIEAPPSIQYTLAFGDLEETELGELVVLPGSIVHLDCLFQKQYGNPKWKWSPTKRQLGNPKWTRPSTSRLHVSGWTISAEERSTWKFRLSLNNTEEEHSGTFRCTTPQGLKNDIKIIVTDVQCPPIESLDGNRVMAVEGTKMHNKAHFACVKGYKMVGTQEIFCTASAIWSDEPPHCKTIECPPVETDDLHLKIGPQNRTYGDEISFSCQAGYHLIGPTYITCLKNETWSDAPPVCEEATCKQPTPPANGSVVDSGRYLAGDFLRYTCNAGHIIVGDPVAVCNDQGEWSQPPPICKAACEFPGEPPNGHLIPTKFHYDIGEMVSVGCRTGFRLVGSQRVQCASSGQWTALPHCRPNVKS